MSPFFSEYKISISSKAHRCSVRYNRMISPIVLTTIISHTACASVCVVHVRFVTILMNFTSSVVQPKRYTREESTRRAVRKRKKEDPPCYLRLKLPWQAQRNEWRVVTEPGQEARTCDGRGEERREAQRRKEQRRTARDLGRITRPIETRKRRGRGKSIDDLKASGRARTKARKEEREGSSMRYVRKHIYSRSLFSPSIYLSICLSTSPLSCVFTLLCVSRCFFFE